jgi:hypothetical protein
MLLQPAAMLKQLSEHEHISPDQLIYNILTENLEDRADAAAADAAILFTGTKRIVGRPTASQIDPASFLFPLTFGLTN